MIEPEFISYHQYIRIIDICQDRNLCFTSLPTAFLVRHEEVERQKAEKKRKEERERALQRATLQLQGRFGKNAVLRGMNLMEGGTTIERNGQIGGHRAEASEVKKDGKRDKKQ